VFVLVIRAYSSLSSCVGHTLVFAAVILVMHRHISLILSVSFSFYALENVPTLRDYKSFSNHHCNSTQLIPQNEPIPHRRDDAYEVDQAADAMQNGKPLIQRRHLHTLLPLLPVLLALDRLLPLAPTHRRRRRGPHGPPIHGAADGHGRDAGERGVVRRREQRRAEAGRGVWVREGEAEGQYGLHAEVDGEEALLQLGELRAREGLVGDDAADEGVEYGGAEEGAVAVCSGFRGVFLHCL
jgi:hypothetical protein